MRRVATVCVFLMAAACGANPSPSTAPSKTALAGTATLSGSVTTTQTRTALGGVTLSLSTVSTNAEGQTGTASTITAADGSYLFSGAPVDLLKLSLTPAGYVPRETLVSLSGNRAGFALDAIADAAPFSLDFYRQFARNAYDAPSNIRPIQRWTIAPSVYIHTQLANGIVLPPAIVDALVRVFSNSIVELSAGQFAPAKIESGTAQRAALPGWITVEIFSPGALGEHVQGSASLGANIATIRLVFDQLLEARYQYDFILHCDAAIVEVADHEIVHAMGFYHTDDGDDFQSGPGCPGTGRSARARYHAAIVYARQPGNVDPDRDIAIQSTVAAVSSAPATISCAPLSVRASIKRARLPS